MKTIIKVQAVLFELIRKHPEYNWRYINVRAIILGEEPQTEPSKKELSLVKSVLENEHQKVINNLNKKIKTL